MKKIIILLLFPMSTLLFFQCISRNIHNVNERNKIKKEYGLRSLSEAQRNIIVQTTTDSLRRIDPSLIFVKIPSNLHIKDKVIVTNKTPYPIQQIAITIINDDGQCKLLGQGIKIDPGISQDLLSLDGNALKTIRKRTLVIKIKDAEEKSSNMNNSEGLDGALGKQQKARHYDIKLSEQRHDLHVDVVSASPFDF